jgi:hypothetical protein
MKYTVDRVTYDTIEVEANSQDEAISIACNCDDELTYVETQWFAVEKHS